MKKLLFITISLILLVAGCHKIEEAKKIIISKCNRCGKILKADTTMVKGYYNKGDSLFTTKDGAYFMDQNDYSKKIIVDEDSTYMICENCQKEMKKEAQEYFRKGKREYSRSNWTKARDYFQDAIKTNYGEYPEAKKWFKKVDNKIAVIQARKKELEDNLLAAVEWYISAKAAYLRMQNDLRYNTVSSEFPDKYAKLAIFAKEVYTPAVKKYGYYVQEYAKKYGPIALRDFAVEHGFLYLLE